MDNQKSKLYPLFHPQSIAVVGVSRDTSSVGRTIFTNIRSGGFSGPVYPINPNAREIDGVPCFSSVTALGQIPDLAVIAVPSAVVPTVLKEVGEKGTKTVIIISSGFRETGKDGQRKEEEIKAIAKSYAISVLGPNCLGVGHPHDNLNISFAKTSALPGSIALLSQSGALGAAILDIARPKGIGFSHLVSLGNEMDITEMDCLEYLQEDDPKTRVIGLYVERLTDAPRFIALCRKLAMQEKPKPVVVLKAGTTKEGIRAVQSHTGSLAGEKESYDALFRQAGVIQAQSLEEFLNTLTACSQNPLPVGNKTALLTNAGGPAILATDTLVANGVELTEFSGHHNPWDMLGDASEKDYDKSLHELSGNTDVHSILLLVTPQTITNIDRTAEVIVKWKKQVEKPLVAAWMGDEVMKSGTIILEKGGVTETKYPENAGLMLSHLHAFSKFRNTLLQTSMRSCPQEKRSNSKPPLSALNPLDVLKSYGIPVPAYVTTTPETLDSVSLTALSDTVAVKILSKDLTHKSDFGAVRLHVPKRDAVTGAKDMIMKVKQRAPDAHIESVLFMNMVDITEKQGVECFIGIKYKEGLGTLVVFGFGGILVELLRDVSMRFAPLSQLDAQDMVGQLRLSPVFDGFRGNPPLDKDTVIQTLLCVSTLALTHPEILEMDINPLVVYPHGVMALDARMTLKK